jgi:hypothetical protein
MRAIRLKARGRIGHALCKIIQLKSVAPTGARRVAQAREITIRLLEQDLPLLALKFDKDLAASRRPYAKMNASAPL